MALLATTLLAACSKVPDGILSEKKMQGVLTDMLLAEAMVNVDYNTYKSDTMKLALYESVFRKHDITQAVYDSSLVWYGRNLDIYMEVYNRVLADLNKRINNLGMCRRTLRRYRTGILWIFGLAVLIWSCLLPLYLMG